MQEKLLKLEEAASRLGIHISTIRAWVRTGRIPSLRVGAKYVRIEWQAVLAAIRDARGDHQGEMGGSE